MAKSPTFDDDDIGKPGKLTRPPKPRGFPWRLWLWAIVMTAGAGAAGYFAWTYREQAGESREAALTAQRASDDATTKLAAQGTELAQCTTTRSELTTTNAKLQKEQEELSTNLSASKEELTQLRAQRDETKKRMAQFEDIQRQFAKMIGSGELNVTSRNGSLVLSLPAEVLFPSGVADLSEDGKIKVIEIGVTLKKFKDRRFLVIGHSDNQPLKNSVYKDNWQLSTARALSVTRFLVQAGMSPKNLLPAGAGEHDPIAPNTSAKDLARNRRIEIALLPNINELPPLPVLEGKTAATKP